MRLFNLFALVLFVSQTRLGFSQTVLEPQLGRVTRTLLTDDFETDANLHRLRLYRGAMRIEGGVLKASEIQSQKHIAAIQCDLPLQNFSIRLDFRFNGADELRIGVNPKPGELKKKGHLFALQIEPDQWSIIENNDKSIPNTKNKTLAEEPIHLKPDVWYGLLLENVGPKVLARIDDGYSLECAAPDFGVKKPGFVIRVGGPDEGELSIDNLRVLELSMQTAK
jgi:hypothetical protein